MGKVIVGIFIRVVLHGQCPVYLLHLLLGSGGRYAQYFVVILQISYRLGVAIYCLCSPKDTDRHTFGKVPMLHLFPAFAGEAVFYWSYPGCIP